MEVDMLGSSRTDVIVDSCFLKDAHEENLGLDVTQQSTEAQKFCDLFIWLLHFFMFFTIAWLSW